MKICFYGYGLATSTSGASRYSFDLAKEMVKRDCEVTIATKMPKDQATEREGVKYWSLSTGNPVAKLIDAPFSGNSLVTFMKHRKKFHVILSLSGWDRFTLAAKVAGLCSSTPVVHTMLAPADNPTRFRGFAKVICTSQTACEELSNAVYIPPFVNLSRFPAQTRTNNGGTSIVRIGTLGPPEPRKGMDILVRALPFVVEKFPDISIKLAIDLPHVKLSPHLYRNLEQIRDLIRLGGLESNVEILGEVDVPTFLSGLDIFVFPVQSPYGMVDPPVTILEAMAARCAIVAPRVSAIADVLSDRDNSLMVNYKDRDKPYEYAKNIIELMENSDLRVNLASKGRKKVENYDVGNIAGKFIDVFTEVAYGKK